MSRGDDARQLMLAALCTPIFIEAIGPCKNFIIPIMIQFGKTQVLNIVINILALGFFLANFQIPVDLFKNFYCRTADRITKRSCAPRTLGFALNLRLAGILWSASRWTRSLSLTPGIPECGKLFYTKNCKRLTTANDYFIFRTS